MVRTRRIVERHAIDVDHAGDSGPWKRQRHRVRRRDDVRLRRQQLHQALGRAGRALHVAPHFGQRADSARGHHGVEDELGQLARRHRPGKHCTRPEPQHEDDGAEHHHDDDRRQRGTNADSAERGDEGHLD